jgi:hypothetical protein
MNTHPSIKEDTKDVLAEKLPLLEDLLWEWVAIQERSIRIWKGKDALWWYGERTTLGAFAGAIWRSGGFVLEEYSTEKLLPNRDSRGNRERCMGRGDMDFELGGRRFTIEAKSSWPRLKAKGELLHAVKTSLKKAERDSACAQVTADFTRLAVVFAAPFCSPRDPESVGDLISTWVQAARNVEDCACAWAFPELGRKLVERKEHRLYPGAALFVRRVGGRRLPA